MVMDEKEREFYFQWITQLMQYNMQMMNNIMQLSMQFVRTVPMPSPLTASAAVPGPMSPNFSAFIPSPDAINKMMKSMMGSLADDDKDKLT